jgi:small GTP-binding protein
MVPPHAVQVKAKVCLLGGRGVGKSALIRRYLLDEFDERYVATLGTKVAKRAQAVDLPGTGPVLVDMTLWDLKGAGVLRSTLAEVVLHNANGVLAVCDVADDRSVAPMTSWIKLTSRIGPGAPVQILVNKFDLDSRDAVVREALDAGRRHGAPCYLTSARTGDNVTAAFEDLALRIAARACAGDDRPLDDASLALLADASARPRSLPEFARSTGMAVHEARAVAENLLRRGYLLIASMDLGPDGRPLLGFTATDKSFARVGATQFVRVGDPP